MAQFLNKMIIILLYSNMTFAAIFFLNLKKIHNLILNISNLILSDQQYLSRLFLILEC